MSLIAAYKTHKLLDPEQKRLLNEKFVEASHTPEQWLEYLKRVSEFDRVGDKARSTAGKMGCTFGILSFLFFFVVGLFSDYVPRFISWPIEVLIILAFLFNGIVWLRFRKVDLSNKLRQFIVPIVAVLREDMDTSAPMSLRLDLRGGTKEEKRTSREELSKSYPKVVESHYVDQWFSGGANLADGSTLQWQIIDYIRERKVTKRNARGKIKSKTKHKIQTMIDVRVGMKVKDYSLASSEASESVAVKSGERRNQLRVRRVFDSRDMNEMPEFQNFLDAVAAVYKQVEVKQ